MEGQGRLKRTLQLVTELLFLFLFLYISFIGMFQSTIYNGFEPIIRTLFVSISGLVMIKHLFSMKNFKWASRTFVDIKNDLLGIFFGVSLYQLAHCLLLSFATPVFFLQLLSISFCSTLISLIVYQVKSIRVSTRRQASYR